MKYGRRLWLLGFLKDFIAGEFLVYGVYAAWLLWKMTVEKRVSVSEMVILFYAVRSLSSCCSQLAGMYPKMRLNSVFIEKSKEVSGVPPADKSGSIPVKDAWESLRLSHVDFSYSQGGGQVLKDINMEIRRGQKIALVGANGIGKTTLLKSILGLTPALSGTVELGDYLSIGYFEQEMPPGNTTTCLQEIWNEFPAYTQYQVRSALAKCGLTTEHIESQVRVLSGGEQAKVRLCKLINRESNVLLLDEPTNHLDVDAKDELKRALKEYKGSILLICHEP